MDIKIIYYLNIIKPLKKTTSYIRIKNRCILTGRSHGIHRLFKISRIKLRELGSHGVISGLTKSS
jgi:small subunit ribosomal protein S14